MIEMRTLDSLSDVTDTTYLDTAAYGLIEDDVLKSAEAFNRDLSAIGSIRAEDWMVNDLPEIRKTLANFMGVNDESVFFGPNFSFPHQSIVRSLGQDKKVLLYEHDYPSLKQPFESGAFDIYEFSDEDGFMISIEKIDEVIRAEGIDILAISHVQWLTGFKIDLVELSEVCSKNGIVFILDTTQSLGATRIDLSSISVDVMISSNYKWMNAGFGTSTVYVSEEFMDKYDPVLEPGHLNVVGLTMLQASVDHKLKRGFAKMEAHHISLVEMLMRELEVKGFSVVGDITSKHRAGIVVIESQDDLLNKCLSNNVIVSERGGRVRISPHSYNSEKDIVKLIDALSG